MYACAQRFDAADSSLNSFTDNEAAATTAWCRADQSANLRTSS